MVAITLRADLTRGLNNGELDANFSNLKTAVEAAALSAAWASVTGTPTTLFGYGITDAQAKDADLTAIAALTGTSGLLKKTAADTWALDTSTFLTSSNYSSYSLPLSGGNVSYIGLNNANAINFRGAGTGTYNTSWITSSLTENIWEAPLTTDAPGGAKVPFMLTWRGGYASQGGLKLTGSASGELGGYTILHGGNFSGYALPLSGGALTGTLNLSTGGDIAWYGGYGSNKSTIGSSGSAITFYPTGASGGGVLTVSATSVYTSQTIAAPNMLLNGNQVLHAGNYSSYSPSLTGSGASGNWGISVSGTSTRIVEQGAYSWPASALPNDYNSGLQVAFVGPSGYGGWQSYGSVLNMRAYSGGGSALQLYVPYSPGNGGTGLQVRFGNYEVSSGNAWTGWKTLLASDNFAGYLTGYYMRAAGFPSSSNDWNALSNTYNNAIQEIQLGSFTGTTNGPTAASYQYGTLINFDSTNNSRAQIYVSHAGNDLVFRGGWGTGSWQTWNKVLTNQNYSSYALPLSGGTLTGDLTVTRIRGTNNLVLNTYATINPSSNVFIYSQANDRDSWLYLDSADTGSNWGIYHRQIDTAVAGLPGNSLGFIGGGSSALKAYICLMDGSANFAGALSQAGNQVLHAGNYSSYVNALYKGGPSSYYQANTWLEFGATQANPFGLYFPSSGAGTHIAPQTDSYGSFRISGYKNTYAGMFFDNPAGTDAGWMTNGNDTGFYTHAYGWKYLHSSGNFYIFTGTYGGGTQCTALHSGNYTSYAPAAVSNSGSMSANLAGNGRALGTTYTNSSGKPRVVYVGGVNAANSYTTVSIDGSVKMVINGYGSSNGTCFIVPNGSTYLLSSGAMSLQYWYEFS